MVGVARVGDRRRRRHRRSPIGLKALAERDRLRHPRQRRDRPAQRDHHRARRRAPSSRVSAVVPRAPSRARPADRRDARRRARAADQPSSVRLAIGGRARGARRRSRCSSGCSAAAASSSSGSARLLVFARRVRAQPAVRARPASSSIGAPLPTLKGITGTLARENAARNPRRTSVTGAAVMIGGLARRLHHDLRGVGERIVQRARSTADQDRLHHHSGGGGGARPASAPSSAQSIAQAPRDRRGHAGARSAVSAINDEPRPVRHRDSTPWPRDKLFDLQPRRRQLRRPRRPTASRSRSARPTRTTGRSAPSSR